MPTYGLMAEDLRLYILNEMGERYSNFCQLVLHDRGLFRADHDIHDIPTSPPHIQIPSINHL